MEPNQTTRWREHWSTGHYNKHKVSNRFIRYLKMFRIVDSFHLTPNSSIWYIRNDTWFCHIFVCCLLLFMIIGASAFLCTTSMATFRRHTSGSNFIEHNSRSHLYKEHCYLYGPPLHCIVLGHRFAVILVTKNFTANDKRIWCIEDTFKRSHILDVMFVRYSMLQGCRPSVHDDVIKWKHFPRYWPFVWGIHRWI